MRNELKEQVILERVELIARLTSEGMCQEKDREIALDLIAELAKNNLMHFYSALSNNPLRD